MSTMPLWFRDRLAVVHETLAEHRGSLDLLRAAMAGWQANGLQMDLVVEARVTLDEAWAALGDAEASLRAADLLVDSKGLGVPPVRGGRPARVHLAHAIDRVPSVQGRLKNLNGRVRAMAVALAGGVTSAGLVAADIDEARARIVGTIQGWDALLQSTAEARAHFG
ncbi:uncharacterized protein [Aegilops tauschii subsp. strangulata]|uniref:uncharacterized protein isoform X2 n=1 Tax=Aegilops tauschii subsp. strangulata TaxID=200361 RepID=UPI001ABCBB90|nr:uncharacterized protein LOC120968249 [Aegilops tauschii subsp. strangulata]